MDISSLCSNCTHLYYDCTRSEDPTYVSECKLDLEVGNKDCSQWRWWEDEGLSAADKPESERQDAIFHMVEDTIEHVEKSLGLLNSVRKTMVDSDPQVDDIENTMKHLRELLSTFFETL